MLLEVPYDENNPLLLILLYHSIIISFIAADVLMPML